MRVKSIEREEFQGGYEEDADDKAPELPKEAPELPKEAPELPKEAPEGLSEKRVSITLPYQGNIEENEIIVKNKVVDLHDAFYGEMSMEILLWISTRFWQ